MLKKYHTDVKYVAPKQAHGKTKLPRGYNAPKLPWEQMPVGSYFIYDGEGRSAQVAASTGTIKYAPKAFRSMKLPKGGYGIFRIA